MPSLAAQLLGLLATVGADDHAFFDLSALSQSVLRTESLAPPTLVLESGTGSDNSSVLPVSAERSGLDAQTGTGGQLSYASAGLWGRPACSILAAGLPRWLCGVVAELPRAGVILSPHDGDERLSILFERLKVSGIIVHDVSSANTDVFPDGNESGLRAALSDIGVRVHTERLVVAADDCSCFFTCRCALDDPLPEWAPTIQIDRTDWDRLRTLAFAPQLGVNIGVERAGINLTVRAAELQSSGEYPPGLRVPDLIIALPVDGLAVSAFQQVIPGALTLSVDLQPFIQAILFFLSNVLLPAVSAGVAQAVLHESDDLAGWARKELRRLRANVLRLPEPPSPYLVIHTVQWPQYRLLSMLNSRTAPGSLGVLPLARLASRKLLKDGRLSFQHLGGIPIMHHIPSIQLEYAGILLEPASIVVSGLHTLSMLRLFQPIEGESSTLLFGAALGHLEVSVRLNITLSLPSFVGSHSSTDDVANFDQTPLLYHAQNLPLEQQVKVTLGFANLSTSALVFAPISRRELDHTNWLYLPLSCWLHPLRHFAFRQLGLQLMPTQILVESDNHDQAYRHELEHHLYQLVSDAIEFFEESYVRRYSSLTPEVIDLILGGPLMRWVNGAFPAMVADLTTICGDYLAPTMRAQPVNWCKAPVVKTVSEQLTTDLANVVLNALGLVDATYPGDFISIPLDGVWLGPVQIVISEVHVQNLDRLLTLEVFQSDCEQPQTLRNTIGLGESGSPLRLSFSLGVQLGCLSDGDRFGGHGCEWHSFDVTLSLASLLVHIDMNVSLMQPYQLPQTVNESLYCALLPFEEVRLLPSTGIEAANWSDVLLEVEVRAKGHFASATLPTSWVYWLVASLLPGTLNLANDLMEDGLDVAADACASRSREMRPDEPEDKESAKAFILLIIYGMVVIISSAVIGATYCCRAKASGGGQQQIMIVSLAAEQPMWQALLITVLCIAVMGMFVISQATGTLGNLFIHVAVAGDQLPVVNGFNITVADTVLEIWSSGSPPLAMLVGGMSGTWPYVKMILALFALWAPPTILPVGRRGAYLFFMDAFGKWSFFDVLLVHLLMSGFKLHFNVPSLAEVPVDECGAQLSLVEVKTEVAPLEKATLFIIALLISLVLTNIINHWHQTSTLNSHRNFTAQLNAAQVARVVRESVDSRDLHADDDDDGVGDATPPSLSTRAPGKLRHSLAQLSSVSLARQATQEQRETLAHTGKSPIKGISTQRLELKSQYISLVKWCIVFAMMLTVAAFFTESFAITVEGLVGNLIASQPGQSARRGFSFFTMGNDLGTSAPSTGWFVQQYHRLLFFMLVFIMPMIWLALCLVIWLVPLEPHTSHTFGLLAQVAYCYTGMDVLVIVILATIFQLGAAVEFQFSSMTGIVDGLIATYFADLVPATSLTAVHTTISLGAAFQIGIGLVIAAALLGTAAGWMVMYTHQRMLHEEMYIFPVQPLQVLQRKSREVRLLALGAAAIGGAHSATSHLPASSSLGGIPTARRGKTIGHAPQRNIDGHGMAARYTMGWARDLVTSLSFGTQSRSRTDPNGSSRMDPPVYGDVHTPTRFDRVSLL